MTAFFDDTEVAACSVISEPPATKRVDVAEFRQLAVSHRRMIRVDDHRAGLRGLRDLDTGETFYADAHRLMAK
jgi:hypothetical protein